MTLRKRLDKVMVARGVVATVEQASEQIEKGTVVVAGLPATSAAMQVDVNVGIEVRESDSIDYVSRGAHKLLAGLDAFGIDPSGLVAMDVGASTGGFTDVLLRRGAAKVYAIDVGYGQLAWALQQDPRVVVMDRCNVKTLAISRFPGGADLAVIDVSFISLTAILISVAALMQPPQEGQRKSIVALVKPQFEVPRKQIMGGGVVESEEFRQGAIAKVSDFARQAGFHVGSAVTSPITGPAGNIEYLLHIEFDHHLVATIPGRSR
jgi:23S rRNA (cytidine1920-2'-O)/16S rRNA (cytidine1409-2'-O)-methyltransferase